jgi:hypothetical protein
MGSLLLLPAVMEQYGYGKPLEVAFTVILHTNLPSRQSLVEVALAEDAFLVAAHIPIGRLQSTPSGIKWVEV